MTLEEELLALLIRADNECKVITVTQESFTHAPAMGRYFHIASVRPKRHCAEPICHMIHMDCIDEDGKPNGPTAQLKLKL